MASKGDEGKKELERELLEAFGAFKTEARRLEGKDNVTESEKKALETLEQEYLAMKAVKDDIVMAEVSKEIEQVQAANGIQGLQDLADATALDINALAKKLKEFPGDTDVQLELNMVETKMGLIKEEFENIENDKNTSEEDKESMRKLQAFAEEQAVYNAIYDEALPIARAGDDMELDMYFDTIERNFANAEDAYNKAVDSKKSKKEQDRLAVIFEEQLLTY